jgi:hypothetical protein
MPPTIATPSRDIPCARRRLADTVVCLQGHNTKESMTEKTQLVFAHAACLAAAALAFWLSSTVLKPYPEAGHLLVGAALWMYGKIGFAPAAAVVESILKRLTPEQVGRVLARASSRPPPMAAGDVGGVEAGPFPLSPSARPPANDPPDGSSSR